MPTFTVETGIMVPMRDGVRLATDVYRSRRGSHAHPVDPNALQQGPGVRV